MNQVFDRHTFGGLGSISKIADDSGVESWVTWNRYGAVEDAKAVTRDVDE
jgi:hypothetical protein